MQETLDNLFSTAPATVSHIDAKGRKYKVKFTGENVPAEDNAESVVVASADGVKMSRAGVVVGAIRYTNAKGKLVEAKIGRVLELAGSEATAAVGALLGFTPVKPKPNAKRDGKAETTPPAPSANGTAPTA